MYDCSMPDDITDIAHFYDCSPDYEDQRLLRHRLEFDLTMRYLDHYLPPNAEILELGAATGRYSVELAKRGHTGLSVDISTQLIERCRLALDEAGQHGWRTMIGDARTVDVDEEFDAVLVMGPLYHLVEQGDRLAVLENARNWLVEGGLVFSAWVSRFGMLGDLIKHQPSWVEQENEVASIMSDGRDLPGPRDGFRGYYARVEEIEAIQAQAGFETVALAAVEPVISADDASYNKLNGSTRAQWENLLFSISQEPSIVGASRHLLYVGRKT